MFKAEKFFNSSYLYKQTTLKMKKLLLGIAILFSFNASAQKSAPRFDFRFGAGVSLQGTGDMNNLMFENELNYLPNKYLAASLSVGFGRSYIGISQTSSFTQGNFNVYVSPLKNNRKNDFRLGTGIGYLDISDVSQNVFEERNSIGFNAIIENTYTVNTRFLIGLRLFTQPYDNGDINSGVLAKVGLRLNKQE